MSKENIVIASILKPVLDTRMYEKIGITLASETNYPIHMVGYGKKGDVQHASSISTWYLGEFPRLSWTRLFKPFQVLWIALQLRPSYFIFCTHELLWVANLLKLIYPSTHLVYDVQENYYLNIRHQNHYPYFVKILLANYVRIKERLLVKRVSKIIFAEQCYQSELSFWKHKAIVLENKCKASSSHILRTPLDLNSTFRFLFSGTISLETGILDALALVKHLDLQGFKVQLLVIGYCANHKERIQILQELNKHDFVKLLNSIDQPVHHDLIIKQIQQADIGLLPYRLNQSTRHKIPTKLYEYLYYQLPILASVQLEWSQLLHQHRAGMCISFQDFNTINWNQFFDATYYGSTINDNSLTWDNDSQQLWPFLNK